MAALPARVKDETRPDFVEDTLRPPKRPMLLATSVVVALIGLLVVLWVRARPWNTRFVNTPAKLGALSGLAALIGLLLLSVTIVLSARIRYVEGALGGLDRVYRVHHRMGAIAFSCLALHPVFLAWRYAQVSWERAAKLWWPTTSDWPLVL
jgi:predicted ferric reductase